MNEIDVGSLIVAHCSNPKEKLWGLLLRLDQVGVVIRGMDLNSVEDWLLQERTETDPLIAPTTFFLPTHRIQRIDLEESGGIVASYEDRYADGCGRDVRKTLMGQLGEPERSDA
jgi:hypothetical protein